MTNQLANIAWTSNGLTNSEGKIAGYHSFAWDTISGNVLENVEADTRQEAEKKLFAALRKRGFRGDVLVSRHGDKLTADGAVSRA